MVIRRSSASAVPLASTTGLHSADRVGDLSPRHAEGTEGGIEEFDGFDCRTLPRAG